MELPQYIVDAFTNKVFAGNPAAVCPLQQWLPDKTLSAIARENNLSETAFFVGGNGQYDLRWFTPTIEIDLCGHATLASAFVIFNFLEPHLELVTFNSQSGVLQVKRVGPIFSLDFPSRPGKRVECPAALSDGLQLSSDEVYLARDYLVVVESEAQVLHCKPQAEALRTLPSLGIIITATGTDCDFVSRAFFPNDSILEDPVTGSAHCTLIPYWSKRLGKKELFARQISERTGELFCEDCGDRVRISGNAVLYGRGTIFV